MRILLTGVRAPVAMDLVAALSAGGHQVWGIDSLPRPVVGPYLNGFYLCASPRFMPDAFLRDICAAVEAVQPDIIIPLCEDVFYWAKASEAHGWPLFATDLATLMRLHSKYAFVGVAAKYGLKVPKTVRFQAGWVGERGQDHVFKPEYSRFGAKLHIRPLQVPDLTSEPTNPWLRQDWVAGEDISTFVVAHEGRITAFSAYRSGWRMPGGVSYYFDPLEPELMTTLEGLMGQLVAGLGFTGQLGCDLRHDPDGQLWFIEANPRATSGLHLLAHDPEALSAAYTDKAAPLLRTSPQAACVGPVMYLSGWPQALRNGRVALWQADMRRARDVTGRGALRLMTRGAGLMAQAVVRGMPLAQFLTVDIECNHDLSGSV
ncbi:MAG: ATP-grasp domain-containing protein [Asticcacaulis sp.]